MSTSNAETASRHSPFAIRHLSPVWTHMSNLVIDHASGSYVYSTDGRKVLDFTSGIGVTNTGHCHPRVVAAAQEQVGKLIHGQINIVFHPPALKLAEKLREVVPAGLDTFFFSNSGAEAVEASIKLARQATGRTNIIVFQGGFHGRTIGAMSLTTSKTIYRVGYQPLMAGVFVAPYAYCHRCPVKRAANLPDGECCNNPLDQVRLLLKQQTAPQETAAILLEPVLGEGGYVLPPASFMQGLREICDEHGILLIADEVQSGFGRTGKFFAVEHFGVTPDILIMAKGLASGFPLSAIAARREIMDKWIPGSHGGTYGGNAVSCAAAVETINVIRDEGLLQNAVERGAQLTDGLTELQGRFPIADVRGAGLMVGVEFADDVAYGTVGKISKACLDQDMLLLTTSIYETIRFIPPLTVSAEEIEAGLRIFERALAQVFGG
ncbi:MAG: aminotransferase class III-fold pyridoxal phosphate-dependent enzyme [Caldilineaceae bacterium]|nr:aminotransferase class III-fold pyridoxal phosphate-dependent enzyme [Caldilineaceae bacterium]MBP8107096.1 aminotransferase class III-fold pyridoxal phosphate-dependent enzyme [Caldilineaceae bacterium]MBP8124690.1 aminotransferase class III-fold pyridoxal phosphate-dependent enzyme [Caldilineaceae bacterium]MBP9072601.1 aminotransferase class III-fold pyridoxal phosphate-dependent enzyme [Caldilineaceae bacterium]